MPAVRTIGEGCESTVTSTSTSVLWVMIGAGELSETRSSSSSFVTVIGSDPGMTTRECSSFVT
jgi:hypothetical protein